MRLLAFNSLIYIKSFPIFPHHLLKKSTNSKIEELADNELAKIDQ